MRVPPIFREVTDADIADIMAFVNENLPWYKPELERLRDSEPDHFRQVCRHLRFEVAQLRDLKKRDPEGFRKAIEEKQLRFRAQDLAAKARAATDPTEREAMVQELRRVIERLFDAEMATRQAQIGQLNERLNDLRQELAQRAANREQIIQTRVEDALKPKREQESKYRLDSKGAEKPEKTEKRDKGDHK
jgi:predicted RNA-binding Zn ribbon-like protein